MWVYYLSDLPLPCYANGDQSLQEVLLITSDLSSNGLTKETEWAELENQFTEVTKLEPSSVQLELV